MDSASQDNSTELAIRLAQNGEAEDEDMDDAADEERPVVRTQHLADALDAGPSFALPSVRDLFNSVLGLYGRRSKSGK